MKTQQTWTKEQKDQMGVCPNCDQWQYRDSKTGLRDCFNGCIAKGIAIDTEHMKTQQTDTCPKCNIPAWSHLASTFDECTATPPQAPRAVVALDGTLPRVFINGQPFNVLSEVGLELIVQRPNGSKQYQARRLGNSAVYGADRAQLTDDQAPKPATTGEPRKSASAHAASHSPLPWKVAGDLDGVREDYREDRCLITDDFDYDERTGSIIGVLRGHGPELRANAAFIVRACNEYEKLLAENNGWSDRHTRKVIELQLRHAETLHKAEANAHRLADALKSALNSIKALDEDYDERESYIKGFKALAQREGDKQS